MFIERGPDGYRAGEQWIDVSPELMQRAKDIHETVERWYRERRDDGWF